MSQEFEKVVLEKLNNFEGRFDKIENTLNEHTGILNEHTGILNEHTGILNEHTEILKDHTKTLNEHTEILKDHTKTLNEHTEQFQKVRKDIYEINNKIIKSAIKMDEIEDVVEYNTQTIKKFNEDHGKKIDIALNAYERLNTRVELNKFLISNLKSNDFQNEIRISALEDVIKQKGLIA